MCKKELERHHIQWKAYTGTEWVHSNTSAYIPPSVPTNKQRRYMNFNGAVKNQCT